MCKGRALIEEQDGDFKHVTHQCCKHVYLPKGAGCKSGKVRATFTVNAGAGYASCIIHG